MRVAAIFLSLISLSAIFFLLMLLVLNTIERRGVTNQLETCERSLQELAAKPGTIMDALEGKEDR